MGTVTAIGGGEFARQNSAATNTWSIQTVINGRASIALDSWEAAIGAAIVTARSYTGVRVNKVGAEWVVSWDSPVTYNPHTCPGYPEQPTWQWPYATYTVTNGETA